MWAVFPVIILALLIFDLGVMNRKDHEIGFKESLMMCSAYAVIALGFGGWIAHAMGAEKFATYLTGYVVELTLSIDNIFAIAMVFSFFAIPRLYQHRVLFWGILGAIVMRGMMISLGAVLVSRFSWVLYVFAVFLIFTGIKMLMAKEQESDMANNPLLRFMRKHFRITETLHGNHFFVKKPSRSGKAVWWMTPLFVCLVMVEFADVIFAVDSVPAIFMITTDPFIIYTSNIFAILGLRAMYFVLASMIARFAYLKYALSLVLIFIGSKSFVAWSLGWVHFPIAISLSVTVLLLGGGIVVSLVKTRKNPSY